MIGARQGGRVGRRNGQDRGGDSGWVDEKELISFRLSIQTDTSGHILAGDTNQTFGDITPPSVLDRLDRLNRLHLLHRLHRCTTCTALSEPRLWSAVPLIASSTKRSANT